MVTTAGVDVAAPFFLSRAWSGAWRLGAAYFACFLAVDVLLWTLAGANTFDVLTRKLIVVGVCAVVTTGISARLYRMRHQPFGRRVLSCAMMAIAAAPLFCLIDYLVYMAFVRPAQVDMVLLGYSLIEGLVLFFGWACLSAAQIYSGEVRDRERQLATVREEALAAQMRALRYQVNPHFLFNTLNSVAGLIEEGASSRASNMVLSLSDFLRATLTLDPVHDVRLSEELALQEDYLLIERERFSDRMELTIDVPAALGQALIPSLLLQPLIENAIKHGIGATAGPVAIAIAATRVEDQLIISIENDMPAVPRKRATRPGAGVGLKNVSERLKTRFGNQGRFTCGPVSPGRWRAEVELPWIVR